VIGIITQADLYRINTIYPTTLDTLHSNMAYLFLESVTQTVPLLWFEQISPHLSLTSQSLFSRLTLSLSLASPSSSDRNISQENLYQISKNVEIVSAPDQTCLVDLNDHSPTNKVLNEHFYIIVKGEVEVRLSLSHLSSLDHLTTLRSVSLSLSLCPPSGGLSLRTTLSSCSQHATECD
jgi:hypothetical protein